MKKALITGITGQDGSYLAELLLEKGYEVQVNNSQGDWRRTAGLYGIDDIKEAPAKDDQWFQMVVKVDGKHVTIAVDGKQLIDYREPDERLQKQGAEDQHPVHGELQFISNMRYKNTSSGMRQV